MRVSPISMPVSSTDSEQVDVEEGVSEEQVREYGAGFQELEKVELPKDGSFIRRLVDPKLPSESERENHVHFFCQSYLPLSNSRL